MCLYREIIKYNCGHEHIPQEFQESPLCLFRADRRICRGELGVYRVLETTVNDWCQMCRPMAARAPLPGAINLLIAVTPQALDHELASQKAERERLNTDTRTPGRGPAPGRLQQINGIAQISLTAHVQSPAMFNSAVCAWIIKYIASLAPWMDRVSLMETVRPWFAELLDEDYQICARPNLKSAHCEHMLDDIMVWTKKNLV
ncbi:hypothetical protein F4776DRAFT_663626 [Hypoxylon sp. NC0597]|nr:hypothetical protein F4776DRAFT_663626 [Hypoxylon sp. NC0597]